MPVSGLIVTLVPPGAAADEAYAWLRDDARFAVGQPDTASPHRLPVTLDTHGRTEDKLAWQQMQDHPGIAFVDVVCVYFDEDTLGTPPLPAGSPTRSTDQPTAGRIQ